MILLSDALSQLSDEQLEWLYEFVLEGCRLRFPVIDLIAVHRPDAAASSLFDNAPLLVEAAVVNALELDWGINDPGHKLSIVEPEELDFPLPVFLACHIGWLSRGLLRKTVPGRLRQLAKEGRWANPMEQVWYGIGQLMVDSDLRGPDALRTFLAALQATRFADAKDLEMWDLAAALLELGNGAFSASGRSLDRSAIIELLNVDQTFQPPFGKGVWMAGDIERVYARIETFRSQCIKAANALPPLQPEPSR